MAESESESEKKEEGQRLPVHKRDASDDDKKLIESVEANWQDHPFVTDNHGQWKEWIAWFEGDQYKYWNPQASTLFDVTPFVDREVFAVVNRLLPMIRQAWGEIRYNHQFYVEPNTMEAEDIKAAKSGSVLLPFLLLRGKFNPKVNLAKLWALITGICYFKGWWNKNLKGYVKNGNKAPVSEPGDVDFDMVNPFNVRPDPLASNSSEWRFFTEGKRVPCTSLEDEFGLPRGSIKGQGGELTYDRGIFEREDRSKSTEATTIRKEHYIRPNRDFPKGRMIVTAEDYLLFKDGNPFPNGEIPYFEVPGIMPVLGDQIPDSMVRMGQNSQRQLNKYASIIDEHVQNFRLKAMIPQGSLFGEDLKAFTRAGVDYVFYNPLGSGTPYWQSPPPIPPFVAEWMAFHEKEIETEMSIREVSMGRLPKYSTRASGTLFQGLKGQDEKVLMPAVESIDLSLQAFASFLLQLVIKHYSLPRMVKIIGRDKRTTVKYIKGSDLRDNTDVRVKSGVDLFSNKELKQDIVQVFVEKGFITDPKKAFELLDVKGIDEFMEEEYIDERQAGRENDVIRDGKIYPKPHRDDNHPVHLKIHDIPRKSEDYDSWDEKAKANLERHKAEHKQHQEAMLKKEAAEKAANAPPAPGAGAPAGPAVPSAGDIEGTPAEMTAPAMGGVPPEVGSEEAQLALAQMLMQGGGAV